MRGTPTPSRFEYKLFYRRNLPHIQPLETDLFLTFRLVGSVPAEVLARMADERRLIEARFKSSGSDSRSLGELARRHFAMLESWLDRATVGPTWLANSRVADVLVEALHYRDGRKYRLDAYSIMPNHVHAVFEPLASANEPEALSSIMHSLKRRTARRANQILQRTGHFWEHESFDHYVRNNAQRKRILNYVMQNPVKAGLVTSWKQYSWNYLSPSLMGQVRD
jgi:REP element-mobilizing transposase RayT